MYRRPRRLPARELPNRLSEWRIARGLSQEALAEKMGSSKQTVHRHENSTDVSLKSLIRYAEILEVRVEELLIDSLRVPQGLTDLLEKAERLTDEGRGLLSNFSDSIAPRYTAETPRAHGGMAEKKEPFGQKH